MGNFIDAVARAVRQASSRACNAIALTGTLSTHLIAVLSDCLCENLGSLEDLFNRYCKRQSALEAEVEEAEAAEAACCSQCRSCRSSIDYGCFSC